MEDDAFSDSANSDIDDNHREAAAENHIPNFLSPSSVRREVKKDDDCKFCLQHVKECEFKKHLIRNKRCSFLYMKIHNVKSLELLLIKLFSCEFCCTRTRLDFRLHLRNYQRCLDKYREKYQIEDIDKLHEKINTLKRKTFPSRAAEVTRRNNNKVKSDHMEKQRTQTMPQSLNEYKEKIAIGNYRLCVQCKSNFRVYGARPIHTEEELFERLNLSQKAYLQRFETMFICHKCDKEPVIREGDCFKPVLGEKVEDGALIFYPTSESLVADNSEIKNARIKVFFPTALEAIKFGSKPERNVQNNVRSLYKTDPVVRAQVQNLYQCEMKKYLNESESTFYSGIVNGTANLKVEEVKKIFNEARIVGSTEWFKDNVKCMKERVQQLGRLHITVKMELPRNCSEVLATCLIQKGVPVTVEKIELGNGSYKIEHKIHEDHMSDVTCFEDCLNKVSIEEYLNKNQPDIDLGNSFVGSYVSSAHEKMISFIRSIVQAPSSGLFSTDYQFYLVSNEEGEASVVGSLWPAVLETINVHIASAEDGCVEEDQIVNFVEGNISCTGNAEILRNQFKISETEAENLGNLVLNTQLHICNEEGDCKYCESLPLPSVETTFKGPCSRKNQMASKQFLDIIRNKLRNLDLEDMKVKLLVWLDTVFEDVEGDINENFEEFTIAFVEENVQISLDIDERFLDYLNKFNDEPYLAAYQYALSCCGQTVGSSIIYKRMWLVDCLIKPYNPLFLNANNYKCEVQIVNNTWLFEQFFLPRMSNKIDSCFLFNHRIISLEEALATSDPLIKKVQTSSKEQFVNAKEKRKATFMKASKDDNLNQVYTLEGLPGTFKMLGNIISRHFDRININDRILLVETALWYDFVGSEKSKELFQTFSNIEIPKSDTDAICTGERLPNYILCNNGDVLKKRREKKILRLPDLNDSRGQMYSKCLLYLPIRSEDELRGSRLAERFKEINTIGIPAFQVELNEKKAFPKKPLKLTVIDLLDDLLNALDTDQYCSDSDDEPALI